MHSNDEEKSYLEFDNKVDPNPHNVSDICNDLNDPKMAHRFPE